MGFDPNLSRALDEWVTRTDTAALAHFQNEGMIIIFDCRHESVDYVYKLDPIASFIYQICDEITSQQSMEKSVFDKFGEDLSHEVRGILSLMCQAGVMISEAGRYLSISVSLDSMYEPSNKERARLARLLDCNDHIVCENVSDIGVEIDFRFEQKGWQSAEHSVSYS